MKILKKIRVALGAVFLIIITSLFLDFTGTLHEWLGWMVKIQFIPAFFALNFGVIALLIILTILFGRIYCSIICPLGVFQDFISNMNRAKNRFTYSPAKLILRVIVLGVFIMAFVVGIGSFVALLDPYSAYGRIVASILSPLYQWINNILAYFAERFDSYMFYDVDVWVKSVGILIIAILTLVLIWILAWRGGRTYCNTVCPVGTILGYLSKISIFKIRIDTDKCNKCGLCARNCKASCIDSKSHKIDYSRCVTCFNCINVCSSHAIRYLPIMKKENKTVIENTRSNQIDATRRNMLSVVGTLFLAKTIYAKGKTVDGGLAFIEDKKIPQRSTRIVPPGAIGINNFAKRCTGCQLCVSVCPNQVLRPSSDIVDFMQPEVSYERGYCRPECTKCSEVCPTGAIKAITRKDKSSTQIGHAVWIEKNCVVINDHVHCGNCASHCPTGAIIMVDKAGDEKDTESLKIPIVNVERCIGCGACENLCPARPFSAIYVEGHHVHRTI